jgi:hypothetical protein
MNIIEHVNEMQEVVKALEERLRQKCTQPRRRSYADRARKQILRIAKEAHKKLDKSNARLMPKWYLTLRRGIPSSKLPEKLLNATEGALARIAHLASEEA